ncbi:MAG: flavin-containing monooxygenase [Candidatus Dormibacteria bacterium]
MTHLRAEVLVLGGGAGGLATAAMLKRRGLTPVVLEASDHVGAAWPLRYDRLRLHTVRWLSHLPGYPIPRTFGKWVPRDLVQRYLEQYARHFELDVRHGVRASRVDPADVGWTVSTDAGAFNADRVVVATGLNHTPFLPDWPGRQSFTGTVLHSSDYRNPQPFLGRRVLVVGAGNSGTEIAQDLAETGAAQVWLSVRTPPNIARRDRFGIPSQLLAAAMSGMSPDAFDRVARINRKLTLPDLAPYGLPMPDRGVRRRMEDDGVTAILDVGIVAAVMRGDVQVVGAVQAFEGGSVQLAGGAVLEPDAVVAATGYSTDLESLVGHLDVLGRRGLPRVQGADTLEHARGLHFIGYINHPEGALRHMARQARRLAGSLARQRNTPVS